MIVTRSEHDGYDHRLLGYTKTPNEMDMNVYIWKASDRLSKKQLMISENEKITKYLLAKIQFDHVVIDTISCDEIKFDPKFSTLQTKNAKALEVVGSGPGVCCVVGGGQPRVHWRDQAGKYKPAIKRTNKDKKCISWYTFSRCNDFRFKMTYEIKSGDVYDVGTEEFDDCKMELNANSIIILWFTNKIADVVEQDNTWDEYKNKRRRKESARQQVLQDKQSRNKQKKNEKPVFSLCAPKGNVGRPPRQPSRDRDRQRRQSRDRNGYNRDRDRNRNDRDNRRRSDSYDSYGNAGRSERY
eukprot:426296_1